MSVDVEWIDGPVQLCHCSAPPAAALLKHKTLQTALLIVVLVGSNMVLSGAQACCVGNLHVQ